MDAIGNKEELKVLLQLAKNTRDLNRAERRYDSIIPPLSKNRFEKIVSQLEKEGSILHNSVLVDNSQTEPNSMPFNSEVKDGLTSDGEQRLEDLISELEDDRKEKVRTVYISILILIIAFIIRWFVSGFSSLLLLMLFCSIGLVVLCFFLFRRVAFAAWTGIIITLFLALIAFVPNSKEKEKETVPPAPLYRDSTAIKIKEEIFRSPDGSILEERRVIEAVIIRVPEINSNLPYQIYDDLQGLKFSHDDLLTQLQAYNEIIERYEKDTLRFEPDRGFLIGELTSKEISEKRRPEMTRDEYSNLLRTIKERLNKMSSKRLVHMWEEYYEYDLYEDFHSEYMYFVAIAYINRGVIYDRLGYPDAALEDYEKGEAIVPYLKSYANHALAYLHKNEYNTALNILDERIADSQLVDHSVEDIYLQNTYLYKGYVYLIIKEFDSARLQFEKALEVQPDNIDAYNYLGIVAMNTGEYAKAVDSFGQAINLEVERDKEFNHGEVSYKWASPYIHNRAAAYRALGKLDLAAADEELVEKWRTTNP